MSRHLAITPALADRHSRADATGDDPAGRLQLAAHYRRPAGLARVVDGSTWLLSVDRLVWPCVLVQAASPLTGGVWGRSRFEVCADGAVRGRCSRWPGTARGFAPTLSQRASGTSTQADVIIPERHILSTLSSEDSSGGSPWRRSPLPPLRTPGNPDTTYPPAAHTAAYRRRSRVGGAAGPASPPRGRRTVDAGWSCSGQFAATIAANSRPPSLTPTRLVGTHRGTAGSAVCAVVVDTVITSPVERRPLPSASWLGADGGGAGPAPDFDLSGFGLFGDRIRNVRTPAS